ADARAGCGRRRRRVRRVRLPRADRAARGVPAADLGNADRAVGRVVAAADPEGPPLAEVADPRGDELTLPPWRVPAERVDLFPPPICTAPTELSAPLPEPPIEVAPPIPAEVPVGVSAAEAEGEEPIEPDCTAPVE